VKKGLLVTAVLLAISTSAFADETLRWRHVQHTSQLQTQEVGDVKGHNLNVYRIPGLALFPDGSIGQVMVVGQSDTLNGTGAVQGYMTMTASDGSELHTKYTGEIKVEPKASPRKGTFIVTGGTGRFANAKGDGTWSGDGAPNSPGAMSYIDVSINLKTAGIFTNGGPK
jgi:hypothetical protein